MKTLLADSRVVCIRAPASAVNAPSTPASATSHEATDMPHCTYSKLCLAGQQPPCPVKIPRNSNSDAHAEYGTYRNAPAKPVAPGRTSGGKGVEPNTCTTVRASLQTAAPLCVQFVILPWETSIRGAEIDYVFHTKKKKHQAPASNGLRCYQAIEKVCVTGGATPSPPSLASGGIERGKPPQQAPHCPLSTKRYRGTTMNKK